MRKKLLKCTALGLTAATMLMLSGCSPHRSPSVPLLYVEDGIRPNGSLPGSVDELTLGERQYYTAQLLNDIRTLNTENLRQFTSDRAVLEALDAIRTDPDGNTLWQEIFSALRYDPSGNVAVYPSPLYTLGKCMASRHDFPADVQQLSAAQVRNILQHEWQDAPYVGTELSAFVSGWRIADGHLDADLNEISNASVSSKSFPLTVNNQSDFTVRRTPMPTARKENTISLRRRRSSGYWAVTPENHSTAGQRPHRAGLNLQTAMHHNENR